MPISSVQLSLKNLIAVTEFKVKIVSAGNAVDRVDNRIYQQIFKVSFTLSTSCRLGVNSFSVCDVFSLKWFLQSDASRMKVNMR